MKDVGLETARKELQKRGIVCHRRHWGLKIGKSNKFKHYSIYIKQFNPLLFHEKEIDNAFTNSINYNN